MQFCGQIAVIVLNVTVKRPENQNNELKESETIHKKCLALNSGLFNFLYFNVIAI